ncbi:hypothetical protein [Streptomyces liangshanensis]|uniref:Uncharacterized protein n=1 Tax=Streptomyces liangshanensis TaxID=2717324 RepID=A0A6G9H3N0_9ACTN|nr:hypothetical protein [Streptomyces liangshanensis]QIQ05115.1 hypothetical protein HA039_25095 [Streptomyces liangshanensis]
MTIRRATSKPRRNRTSPPIEPNRRRPAVTDPQMTETQQPPTPDTQVPTAN